MDNSTVIGDNMSVLSVPYKDSRPSTPSRMPLNPRVAGYTPAYPHSDVFELNSLSSVISSDPRDPNDLTSLLPHGRGQSRNPSPMGRGGYM
jgi:hypothetical protein